jgi:hypothetical protein
MSGPESDSDDLFGDEVFRYTRADALQDGILLDITDTARICGRVVVPAAMTIGLWQHVAGGEAFAPADERVKDVCYALAFASVGLIPSQRFEGPQSETMLYGFEMQGRSIEVKAVAHPGDNWEPVLTLMLPTED